MNDELLRLLGSTGDPEQDLSASGSGAYRYVGAYKAFRAVLRVGGDITGTSPTLDMTIQADADGVGTGTTVATFTQITTEQVGYIATTTPRYEVPGTYPQSITFETGANPYVRAVWTLGGTTPVFNDVSVELVPIKGFASQRSGS